MASSSPSHFAGEMCDVAVVAGALVSLARNNNNTNTNNHRRNNKNTHHHHHYNNNDNTINKKALDDDHGTGIGEARAVRPG